MGVLQTDPRLQPGAYVHDERCLYEVVAQNPAGSITFEDAQSGARRTLGMDQAQREMRLVRAYDYDVEATAPDGPPIAA